MIPEPCTLSRRYLGFACRYLGFAFCRLGDQLKGARINSYPSPGISMPSLIAELVRRAPWGFYPIPSISRNTRTDTRIVWA